MDENISNLMASTRAETSTLCPQPKKKRNLAGNPDPDAEVIALSPKSLLATNRFMCEICNKGFQRDQNLQLHRRGHNLPWKLKQRTNKDVVRKKVYVCPEMTCVHHDPSRALGDLTGIKKHFCRKHGEKKWKCEKCSKRYAVQSDWKAHSKICGTREYRCDCGTLFSRRDSFITHRAFCDALAEESARVITQQPGPGSSVSHINMTNLEPQPQLHSYSFHVKREQDLSSSPFLLGHPLLQNGNPSQNPSSSVTLPPFQDPSASPHMSATALLQRAAQMGVTMSKPLQSPLPYHHGSTTFSTSSFGLRSELTEFTHGGPAGAAPSSQLHGLMSCLSSTSELDGSSCFEQSFNGTIWNTKRNDISFPFQETTDRNLSKTKESQLRRSDHEDKGSGSSTGWNDELTRDFLGLKDLPHSLAGLNHHRMDSSSTFGQQNQQSQTPWQA
ncbi:hypothetical protein HRI_001808000 [Hibiscus trionum]|uniref:C2H2-type domain-containing protein n=1 Tax=Hibiscus trionum TaxID=183268 RepID=A0A9W7HR05_HIBTR|nr:hypothetical protein HRI_001808000 [Hibiscus trionum]